MNRGRLAPWKNFTENMEFNFKYLPEFVSCLEKLPKRNQRQIIKKIKAIQEIQDLGIFRHVIPLVMPIGRVTHKLKMGEYRIYVRVEGQFFEFQNVIKRGDAYR